MAARARRSVATVLIGAGAWLLFLGGGGYLAGALAGAW